MAGNCGKQATFQLQHSKTRSGIILKYSRAACAYACLLVKGSSALFMVRSQIVGSAKFVAM